MTVLGVLPSPEWTPCKRSFQAVLMAQESNGKKLWKRVVRSETEFAWLPPNIAWAFLQ